MSFGENLQFLRKLNRGMTQEELAERLNVSRQTVSKWEMNAAYPEMDKAIALTKLFSCSLDDLLVNDICTFDKAYSNMRVETVPAFRYMKYAVISSEPEDDALMHMRTLAGSLGIEKPELIGWDFPVLSQEQINVYHMHGYAAALILPDGAKPEQQIDEQADSKYAAITILEPFTNAFLLIPNAYKTLMRYMELNGLGHKEADGRIPCFEKTYQRDGSTYMDVYISIT